MNRERLSAVVISVLLVVSAATVVVPASAFVTSAGSTAAGNDSPATTVTTTSGATTTTAVEPTTREATTTTDSKSGKTDPNRSDRNSDPKVASSLLDRIEPSGPTPDGTERARFVQVVVRASPGRSDEAAGLVGTNGGEVETRHDRLVQARMPESAVRALASSPAVEFVREPHRPDTDEITSEGLDNMDVESVHDAGHTGDGVTVAVVDSGFDVTNPEIADRVVDFRNFSSPDPEAMSNATGEHGTATAELVADTAPNASIIAVKVGTEVELYEAIDWLESETDADVVTMSMSWYNVGPLDGTARMNREINASIRNGTTWLTSAGNDGYRDHWNGEWSDPDGDGWMNFDGSDEAMNVTPAGGSGYLNIAISWNDWGGSHEDYDAHLVNESGGIVASSTNVQDGTQSPTEWFYGYTNRSLYLKLENYSANGTADFDVFFRGSADPEYSTRTRSVTLPGTGRNIIAVGAADHRDNALEYFSSRGPTIDGRIKPDVVGPDGVTTSGYSDGFYGTSAATPHTAGVVALMLDADPGLAPAEAKDRLRSSAVPLWGDEPNNRTGYGLVDADGAIPSVEELYPDRVAYSGRLEESDGDPAVDDEVAAYRLDSDGVARGRTSADGRFSLSAMGTDDGYVLGYYQGDFGQRDETFMPRDGSPDLHALGIVDGTASADIGNVTLPEANVLNVTVVDESGDSVPNAGVRVEHFTETDAERAHASYTAETRSDGALAIGNEAGIEVAGEVRVEVTPPADRDGYEDETYGRSLTVANDASVTVTLEETVTVEGTVSDADGSVSDDTLVYAFSGTADGDRSYLTADTGADGRFRIEGLEAGEPYAISAVQDYNDEATFVRDGTADLFVLDRLTPTDDEALGEYQLPDGHVVDVRVEDESGDSVENASVLFQHHRFGETAGWRTLTNENGAAAPRGNRGMELAGNASVEVEPPENATEFVAETYVRDLDVTTDENVTITLDEKDLSSPAISSFEVSSFTDESTLEIKFLSDEPLETLELHLTDDTGDTVATFTEQDISPNQMPGGYKYQVTFSVETDGRYRATLTNASDEAGNDDPTGETTDDTVVDTTPPTVTESSLADADENGAVSDGERVSVSASVTDALSSVESVAADASAFGAGTVELTHSGDGVYEGAFDVDASASPDGPYRVSLTATDAEGNEDAAVTRELLLDAHAPNTTHSLDGTLGADGWYTSPVAVNLTADDGTSSVARTEYRVDGGDWTTYESELEVTEDGRHTVAYRSVDAVGNAETAGSTTFEVDATIPTTEFSTNASENENGWYDSDVTVALDAADATSGVDATYYRVDDGPWKEYDPNAGVTLATDGEHTVEFHAADAAGNRETTRSRTVKIDTRKPTLAEPPALNRTDGIPPERPIRVILNATDDGSGVASVVADGVPLNWAVGGWSGAVPADPALGDHAFEAVVADVAGNEFVVSDASTAYGVGETVEMSRENDTLAVEPDDANVDEIIIETNDSTGAADVTVGTSKRNPEPARGDPAGTALYFPQVDTSVSNDDIENATVTVAVERSRVRQKYVEPASVAFWVEREHEPTGWEAVDARRVDESDADGTYTYEVAAPHFSTYAVTGERESTPPTVTALGPESDSPAPGEVTVTAEYGDDYSGVDPANVTLELDGEDVTADASVTASGLTYTANLTAGDYTVGLSLLDNASNAQLNATTFTVAAESADGSGGGGGDGGSGGGGGGNVPPPAVQVSVEERTDGRFRAKIVSARADSPGVVSLDGGIAAGDVTLRRLAVTPESADAEPRFFVTARVGTEAPDGAEPIDAAALGYLRLSPTYISDSELAGVAARFAVPASEVGAPGDVVTYRLDGGEWHPVETAVVGERDGRYVLEAIASETGTFAVGARDTVGSETDATGGTTETGPDETTTTGRDDAPADGRTTGADGDGEDGVGGDGGVPGFGAGTALLALSAAIRAARRRT